MKKFFLIAIVLIISLFSCNKDNEIQIDNSDLVGKWNWESTDGGLANHIHETPTSTGKTVELNLMGNYNYSIKENGNEISNGTYELTMKKSIHSGKKERFITYSKNQQLEGVVISGIITIYDTNKLDVSDNNYDGIGSRFEKNEIIFF